MRILIGLSIAICLLAQNNAQAQIAPLPYQDPRLPAEQRADDLLSRLTLEEKVSLMMNGSPAIKRLGIPQFEWWAEALHGIGRNGFATVFPITTAMAASWNDALVYQCFSAIGDEGRAKGNEARRRGNVGRYQGLSFWTPNINIFRDPRWGRGQETYGEDPFLTGRMGIAVVHGLQGTDTVLKTKLLSRKMTYINIYSVFRFECPHNPMPCCKVFLRWGISIDKSAICLQTSRSNHVWRLSPVGVVFDVYGAVACCNPAFTCCF